MNVWYGVEGGKICGKILIVKLTLVASPSVA